MGYTHYWYREPKIAQAAFDNIVTDFSKLVPVLAQHGVPLAGPLGTGGPVLSAKEISFNGKSQCGHPKNSSVSIPWPSKKAGGVAPSDKAVDGQWFAGATLESRCCDGDCNYETCHIGRTQKPNEWERKDPTHKGKVFNCCKTAFRPYDIAVTALLIICKHHLGDKFVASSDGEDQHWFDGKMLCQTVLDYGLQYILVDGDLRLAATAQQEV